VPALFFVRAIELCIGLQPGRVARATLRGFGSFDAASSPIRAELPFGGQRRHGHDQQRDCRTQKRHAVLHVSCRL